MISDFSPEGEELSRQNKLKRNTSIDGWDSWLTANVRSSQGAAAAHAKLRCVERLIGK